MTTPTPAVDTHAGREALHEVRERRGRQDDKLRSRIRIVAGTLGLYVPVVAIATLASGERAPLTAGLMLSVGLGLFFIAVLIDYFSYACWRDGPDFYTLKRLNEDRSTPHDVDLHLVDRHEDDYNANERTLVWVTASVAVFVLVVLFMSTYVAVKLFEMGVDSVETPEAVTDEDTGDCYTQQGDPSGLRGVNRYAIALLRGTANAGELDEFSHCEHLPVIKPDNETAAG